MKRAALMLSIVVASLLILGRWREERERSDHRKRYAELAVEAYEKGAYERALFYADRTEVLEDDTRLRRFRAEVLIDLGRLDEAAEVLDDAIARDPDFASLYAVRAKLHMARGDAGAAVADLEAALARKSVDRDTDWMLSSIYLDLHRYPEALAACERADAARPRVAGILINCGLARAGTGDLAGAARDFDAAYGVARDHRALRALALRGRARLQTGDPQGAIEDLDQLVKAGRAGSDDLWALGVAHHTKGDYARAAESYARALQHQQVSDRRRSSISRAAELASAGEPLAPELVPMIVESRESRVESSEAPAR